MNTNEESNKQEKVPQGMQNRKQMCLENICLWNKFFKKMQV